MTESYAEWGRADQPGSSASSSSYPLMDPSSQIAANGPYHPTFSNAAANGPVYGLDDGTYAAYARPASDYQQGYQQQQAGPSGSQQQHAAGGQAYPIQQQLQYDLPPGGGPPTTSMTTWALMDWSQYAREEVGGLPHGHAHSQQHQFHQQPQQQQQQQQQQFFPYALAKPSSPPSSSSSPSLGPPPPSASSSSSSSAVVAMTGRGGHPMDPPSMLPSGAAGAYPYLHSMPASYGQQHEPSYNHYRAAPAVATAAYPTAGDESDSSYTAIDRPTASATGGGRAARGSARRGSSRTRVATSQKTATDDDEKQARRREQNRTAQRAYKARQNKHIEEVEIRNKELETEVRQQREVIINMRDLLMRCQQENDVLRRVLKPLEPPDDEQTLPSDAAERDGLQEIIDAHSIRPAIPPSERRMPNDSRRRADEEMHLLRLRERYESYRVRIAAAGEGWRAISASTWYSANSLAAAAQMPADRLKVEHTQSASPPLRSPLGDEADGSDQRRSSRPSSTDSENWMPEPTDDSPIDDDNLQGLLGPRYWNHGTQLLPPPPRLPLRGIWREIKAAAPDVSKDDIDIDLLCTSLRRSTFCDGIEPCIPKPAFRYIVEHIVQSPMPSGASIQLAAATAASGLKAEQTSPQPPNVRAMDR